MEVEIEVSDQNTGQLCGLPIKEVLMASKGRGVGGEKLLERRDGGGESVEEQ